MTKAEIIKNEKEAFEDRISIPPCDQDLTPQEFENLIKEGLI